VLLVANLAAEPRTVEVGQGGDRWRLVLSTDEPQYGGGGAAPDLIGGEVRMPAGSAALWADDGA
jgi:hypothetical protein